MTIKELLKNEKGNYYSWEVFRGNGNELVATTANLLEKVKSYTLMDEDEYNRTIMANNGEYANFEEWYDDKNAIILVIEVRGENNDKG